jgi:hypothetical protein
LMWWQRRAQMPREAERARLSRAFRNANKGHGGEGQGVTSRTDDTVVGATQGLTIAGARPTHPVARR